MLSVKGSGSIRCELMRQEGGEECEECPCLCRTPFSSLASRGRPERIKASGCASWPHTTTLPRREEAASATPTADDPLPSARRQPPRPTAPETAARRVPTPPPARTRAARPARRATPAPPPPAARSAPTMSAAGLGPVRCAFVLLLALCSRVSTGDPRGGRGRAGDREGPRRRRGACVRLTAASLRSPPPAKTAAAGASALPARRRAAPPASAWCWTAAAAAACAPSSWASCAPSATPATRTRASSATSAPRPTARSACAPVRPAAPVPFRLPGPLAPRRRRRHRHRGAGGHSMTHHLFPHAHRPAGKESRSNCVPSSGCFPGALLPAPIPDALPVQAREPMLDPCTSPFSLPLLQPKMVPPASSEGRCTGAESPSRAAANTSALAWTGRWAAYPCAAWTSACPAPTAPSHEGSSCPGNAARSGCVTSPRTTLWSALPSLVS